MGIGCGAGRQGAHDARDVDPVWGAGDGDLVVLRCWCERFIGGRNATCASAVRGPDQGHEVHLARFVGRYSRPEHVKVLLVVRCTADGLPTDRGAADALDVADSAVVTGVPGAGVAGHDAHRFVGGVRGLSPCSWAGRTGSPAISHSFFLPGHGSLPCPKAHPDQGKPRSGLIAESLCGQIVVMEALEWPPTETELIADLEVLRKPGLRGLGQCPVPALERAALRLDYVLSGDKPHVEALLRWAAESLGSGPDGKAARHLFGLGDDERGIVHSVRFSSAADEYGRSPQTFRRRHLLPLLTQLARQIVQAMTQRNSEEAVGYRSPFEKWDKEGWVRSRGHNEDPFEPGRDFFSRALVPILDCEEATSLSPDQQREILVYYLYNYLEFTVRLETGPVNDICRKIREASFLEWLPVTMKDDALRIYTDEGGHAEMSNALRRQVQQYTGLKPLRTTPQFLAVLDKLRAERLNIEGDLVTLFFVIVSETLITGSLNKLPQDPTVQTIVRNVAKDHARDEGRHHTYFSQLLMLLWPRLPRPLRRDVVTLLPTLLHAFLDPDRPAIRQILAHYPRVFPRPGETVDEIEHMPSVQRGLQSAAARTLVVLRRAGVLDEPQADQIFEAGGFIMEDAT